MLLFGDVEETWASCHMGSWLKDRYYSNYVFQMLVVLYLGFKQLVKTFFVNFCEVFVNSVIQKKIVQW